MRETGGLLRVTFPGVDSRSAPVFVTIPRYPQWGELVLPLRGSCFGGGGPVKKTQFLRSFLRESMLLEAIDWT